MTEKQLALFILYMYTVSIRRECASIVISASRQESLSVEAYSGCNDVWLTPRESVEFLVFQLVVMIYLC